MAISCVVEYSEDYRHERFYGITPVKRQDSMGYQGRSPWLVSSAATTLPMNPAPPVTRILTRQFHSQLDLRAADPTGQPDAPGAETIQGGSMYARGAPPLFEELSR